MHGRVGRLAAAYCLASYSYSDFDVLIEHQNQHAVQELFQEQQITKVKQSIFNVILYYVCFNILINFK